MTRPQPPSQSNVTKYLVALAAVIIVICWWLVNLPNLIVDIMP